MLPCTCCHRRMHWVSGWQMFGGRPAANCSKSSTSLQTSTSMDIEPVETWSRCLVEGLGLPSVCKCTTFRCLRSFIECRCQRISNTNLSSNGNLVTAKLKLLTAHQHVTWKALSSSVTPLISKLSIPSCTRLQPYITDAINQQCQKQRRNEGQKIAQSIFGVTIQMSGSQKLLGMGQRLRRSSMPLAGNCVGLLRHIGWGGVPPKPPNAGADVAGL